MGEFSHWCMMTLCGGGTGATLAWAMLCPRRPRKATTWTRSAPSPGALLQFFFPQGLGTKVIKNHLFIGGVSNCM